MSKEQYNLTKQTNYLSRKMFLDGVVTVQRFEEVKYPKLQSTKKRREASFGSQKKLH